MSYKINNIYRTIQGEGIHAGRPCVLVRFAGCNLWSGREADRGNGGSCSAWCDTDFADGDRIGADALAGLASDLWGSDRRHRFVLCTGGEPLLQLDTSLVDALHRSGFAVHVETNGTRPVPPGVDWLTVSPKAGSELLVTAGDELKLVYPQVGSDPAEFAALPFRHFLLQPMDGPERAANTAAAIDYCYTHPRWRLGLQMHKFIGLP